MKNKLSFTSDEAVMKSIYLATREASKNEKESDFKKVQAPIIYFTNLLG